MNAHMAVASILSIMHAAWTWLRSTTLWPTDSTSFWTMILSGSVFYAGAQFYFTRQTEQRRRASELAEDYYVGDPTPSKAWQTLAGTSPEFALSGIGSGALLSAWVSLSNYVDKADTWLSFNMVDERLYLEHVHRLLGNAIHEYDRWKSAVLPMYINAAMWERMRKRVNRAKLRLGDDPI